MKNIKVSNTDQLRTAIEAGYTKDEIEIVAVDNTAAIAAARREGVDEGKAAGITEGKTLGAQAERDRIAAINDLALEGFAKERDEAIKTGASVADFGVAQSKAMKDRGPTANMGAMRRDAPAGAHANQPKDDDGKAAEVKSGWDHAVATVKKQLRIA